MSRTMKTSAEPIDQIRLRRKVAGTFVWLGETFYRLEIASVIDNRNASPGPIHSHRRPDQIAHGALNAGVVATRVRTRALEIYAMGNDIAARAQLM
jgi:hypothetical protein